MDSSEGKTGGRADQVGAAARSVRACWLQPLDLDAGEEGTPLGAPEGEAAEVAVLGVVYGSAGGGVGYLDAVLGLASTVTALAEGKVGITDGRNGDLHAILILGAAVAGLAKGETRARNSGHGNLPWDLHACILSRCSRSRTESDRYWADDPH